ncbi:MAG: class I SAM-dependent methyltransferase [Bauldia sp.]|nr:class I SAM-dependent methyltransferase [Bauldia sp.]
MFEPFEALLTEPIPEGSREAVLDVGCGAGATTIAMARRLGGGGRSVGVDISAPLIAAATARAARLGSPATFVCADAECHAFGPDSFDRIISRFGVMFFSDPVMAFANLRRAGTSSAELRFVAWRDPEDNPFMTTAERAAAPLLPHLPPRRRDGPGQFAFTDRNHVARILDAAGWRDIDIAPLDVACRFAAADLARFAGHLGPVGAALREADEATRARVTAAVRTAFEPYVHGPDVRFVAACWMVGARR